MTTDQSSSIVTPATLPLVPVRGDSQDREQSPQGSKSRKENPEEIVRQGLRDEVPLHYLEELLDMLEHQDGDC